MHHSVWNELNKKRTLICTYVSFDLFIIHIPCGMCSAIFIWTYGTDCNWMIPPCQRTETQNTKACRELISRCPIHLNTSQGNPYCISLDKWRWHIGTYYDIYLIAVFFMLVPKCQITFAWFALLIYHITVWPKTKHMVLFSFWGCW